MWSVAQLTSLGGTGDVFCRPADVIGRHGRCGLSLPVWAEAGRTLQCPRTRLQSPTDFWSVPVHSPTDGEATLVQTVSVAPKTSGKG